MADQDMSKMNSLPDQSGGGKEKTMAHYVVIGIAVIVLSYVALAANSMYSSQKGYQTISSGEMVVMLPVDWVFYSLKGTVLVSSSVMSTNKALDIVDSINQQQVEAHYQYYLLFSKVKKIIPVDRDQWLVAVGGSLPKLKIFSRATIEKILVSFKNSK